MKKVAIIGQGYVGLPLSLAAASAGFNVFGVDSDLDKASQINSGNSPIEDISGEEISSLIRTGSYCCLTHFENDFDAEVILICVPTPLDSDHKPDLSYLRSAVESVGKVLKKGGLVVFCSTF